MTTKPYSWANSLSTNHSATGRTMVIVVEKASDACGVLILHSPITSVKSLYICLDNLYYV